MREAEWFRSVNPFDMLAHIRDGITDRKMRLFVCACCRRMWNSLNDATSRRAVEVGERYADGEASEEELKAAWLDAQYYFGSTCRPGAGSPSGNPCARAACNAADPSALLVRSFERTFKPMAKDWPASADLMRDIFGQFAGPKKIDSRFLTPNVLKLAWDIYHERAFHRLPNLADALQDAGCKDMALLGHCRTPRMHARGCWAVDLILGRG